VAQHVLLNNCRTGRDDLHRTDKRTCNVRPICMVRIAVLPSMYVAWVRLNHVQASRDTISAATGRHIQRCRMPLPDIKHWKRSPIQAVLGSSGGTSAGVPSCQTVSRLPAKSPWRHPGHSTGAARPPPGPRADRGTTGRVPPRGRRPRRRPHGRPRAPSSKPISAAGAARTPTIYLFQ